MQKLKVMVAFPPQEPNTQKKLKDMRYQIHGHDFIELLSLYIRPDLRKEIRNSYNSEILAGSLLGCVDADYLMQETLFQKLLARMSYSPDSK